MIFRSFVGIFVLALAASPAFSASSAAVGKTQFGLCLRCHGKNAEGNIKLKAPAIAGLPAWYIEKQLKTFKSGGRGTHPDDIAGMRMRSMARVVKKEERIKAVAEYVSKLPTTAPEKTLDGDAHLGKTKFMTCVACHGANGKGMKALKAPPLIYSNDWYLLTQLKHFKAKIRGGNPALDASGSLMVPMAMTLNSDKDIANVLAYIYTLR